MTSKGEETQIKILKKAVQIASVEGLETMSLGRLAAAIPMSKSGLFAHFRSKEALQIAVVRYAARIFAETVVTPALIAPAGLPRLWRVMETSTEYYRGDVFCGGCFFIATAVEFDGRPGPVRQLIVDHFDEWMQMLTLILTDAEAMGHLKPGTDIEQLAFELQSVLMGMNWANQLWGDSKQSFRRGSQAWQSKICAHATDAGIRACVSIAQAEVVAPVQAALQ